MVLIQVTVLQEQAALLRQHVPGLFAADCHVQLMTENGRSLLAKAGFVASRVEYTKSSGGRHIAVAHIGADLLMRMCYLPDTWLLRVFVCDADGNSREGSADDADWVEQDIAGPLCFQVCVVWTGAEADKANSGINGKVAIIT